MSDRIVEHSAALLFAFVLTVTSAAVTKAEDGIVKVRSAHSLAETIARLKRAIAAQGMMASAEAGPATLAANAGVTTRPSTLLMFGNPALHTLVLRSNAEAGLAWPVRLLVIADENHDVYAVYPDFAWIAKRHDLEHVAAFASAAAVMASLTACVRGRSLVECA